ncbi:MAG TPA: AsmA-like C-terminal region-containing protein [Candidatus Cybelea sp.]|nr:AsmA-like C-terminal region-containing protein [Candidatus Cybelea sp.]
MSQSITEPMLTLPTRRLSARGAARLVRSRFRWLGWILLAVIGLWLAGVGLALSIEHTSLKRRVTARLETSFGRPVTVGGYSFSFWTGPTLEAYAITVGEDPRFGNEYFLRADSLIARVHWHSLLSGHLELGTISLEKPSLNLVRNADGDWNLAEWLPRPAAPSSAPGHASRPTPAPTFRKITVRGGRIDFKHADEKLPFALVDVTATLESAGGGRWRLDLVAVPARAAIVVQQPGVLHLVGDLGGTSSRLRPASLELDGSNASISDVLRLSRGGDYGVRGSLDVSLSARTEGDSWLLAGKATLGRLHRWDLALRGDNPSVNIQASGVLDSTGSRIDLREARIEAPFSSARLEGALDWSSTDFRRSELRVTSEALSLADLLAWARAFHSGIRDGVALDGFARAGVNLEPWPPRVETATFNLPHGTLSANGIRGTLRASDVLARYDREKGLSLSSAVLTIGGPGHSFRVEGTAKGDLEWFRLRIQGSTGQVRDVAAISKELGWDLVRGWDMAGPARCDLEWQGSGDPLHTSLTGSIDWGTPTAGASLRLPFLNLPVERIRARTELKPDATHAVLIGAEAFGTAWTGTFEHDLSAGWQFAVSGDALSTVDLDRWLDPRWRETFLDRMLPFLNSRPATANNIGIRARGRLELGELTLAPVAVHRLRGQLTLDGRHLEFSKLDGKFYGGSFVGSLEADLGLTPRYRGALEFSGVNLSTLSGQFPALTNLLTGSVSARMMIGLRGATRADLLSSFECRGTARANELAVEGVDLGGSAATSHAQPPSPSTTFRDGSAAFSCRSGQIELEDVLLSGGGSSWRGGGSVDYARRLDLRLRALDSPVEYHISGTIHSPEVSQLTVPPPLASDRR